jgi:hypothetical protein
MYVLDETHHPQKVQADNARCQIDLLQLIGFLKFRGSTLNSDNASFKQVLFPSDKRTTINIFAGAEQAAVFLHAFRISEQLVEQLKLAELVEKLVLNPESLRSLPNPLVRASFLLGEGQRFQHEPCVALEGLRVALAILMPTAVRICYCQTSWATHANSWCTLGSEVHLVQGVSKRLYTPTFGAYYSRAMAVGGYARSNFWHKPFEHNARPANKHLRWTINSLELETKAKQRHTLIQAGYAPGVADNLMASGLYAIPADEYVSDHLAAFALDGQPPGQFFCSDMEQQQAAFEELRNDRFLLIDSYYGHIWPIMGIRPVCAYGRTTDLPLSYDGLSERFINQVKRRSFTVSRAGRVRVPRILLETYDELLDLIQAIREVLDEAGEKGKQIFFRGQTRHHSIRRHPSVCEFLYGTQSEDEVSLCTAASRASFDYDHFTSEFQLQLQSILYSREEAAAFQKADNTWLAQPIYRCPFNHPGITQKYLKWLSSYLDSSWDVVVMGLAQHYGIPTHGLDITSDLDTAIWFAKRQSQPRVPAVNVDHGVLYIIATDSHLLHQLDNIADLGFEALRPRRQKAFLHYGGWGLHSNLCAEEVVAVVHLGEKIEPANEKSLSFLFPPPDEDLFYENLLRLQKLAQDKSGYSYLT